MILSELTMSQRRPNTTNQCHRRAITSVECNPQPRAGFRWHIVFYGNFLGRRFGSRSRCDVLRWFPANLRSMFYPVSSVVIVILFLSVVARGSSQTEAKKAKHYALYAPRPQYPLKARKHHWTGSGLVRVQYSLWWNGSIGGRNGKHQSSDVGSSSDYSVSAVEIPARRQTCDEKAACRIEIFEQAGMRFLWPIFLQHQLHGRARVQKCRPWGVECLYTLHTGVFWIRKDVSAVEKYPLIWLLF